MNYTEKYHLPQWDETDRIMRVDFNAAMANIEDGLASNSEEAAALPYATGIYTGNGSEEWVLIPLGFKPRFVIVTGQGLAIDVTHAAPHRFAIVGESNGQGSMFMKLTAEGFQIRDYKLAPYPNINAENQKYSYIAFR